MTQPYIYLDKVDDAVRKGYGIQEVNLALKLNPVSDVCVWLKNMCPQIIKRVEEAIYRIDKVLPK